MSVLISEVMKHSRHDMRKTFRQANINKKIDMAMNFDGFIAISISVMSSYALFSEVYFVDPISAGVGAGESGFTAKI